MIHREHALILASGRELSANRCIVGINHELDTFGGYDENLIMDDFITDDPPLTRAEREELADYMIALWRSWKEAV